MTDEQPPTSEQSRASEQPPASEQPRAGEQPGPDYLRILFICTANQCRSPLAEVLAVEQLKRRGVRASVGSAGYLEGGVEAASGSQKAARRLGLDLSNHRSRKLSAEMVETADVVIGMEPGHVLDLSDDVPGAQAWSLTLKELAGYAKAQSTQARSTMAESTAARTVGVQTSQPMSTKPMNTKPMNTTEIRASVRSAGSRSLQSLLNANNTVVDPIGRSDRAFRATAKEIDQLLTEIFDFWFGHLDDRRFVQT